MGAVLIGSIRCLPMVDFVAKFAASSPFGVSDGAMQARAFQLQPGIMGEVRLVERAFGIGPDMKSELMSLHGAALERIAVQQGF